MLKKSFLQKDIIFSIHASNNTTLKYVRQKLIKLQGERHKSTIVALNTALSVTGRCGRQKTSKDELNSIINPLDLINFIKYYIQQHRILSSQADMKCSPDSPHSG